MTNSNSFPSPFFPCFLLSIHYLGILLKEIVEKPTGNVGQDEEEEIATSPIEDKYDPMVADPIEPTIVKPIVVCKIPVFFNIA